MDKDIGKIKKKPEDELQIDHSEIVQEVFDSRSAEMNLPSGNKLWFIFRSFHGSTVYESLDKRDRIRSNRIIARRSDRSTTIILGVLATIVLSVMMDPTQSNEIWSLSRTRSDTYL